MADDPEEPTPRERPGKRPSAAAQWGDDERAAVGREHRAGEPAKAGKPSTDSQRRRARRDAVHPLEVPIVLPPPDLVERELGGPGEVEAREITQPWEIADRDELTDDEAQIVQRSKRKSEDPLTLVDFAKLMSRLQRKELDDRSAEKRAADRMLELLRHPPHEAVAQLQRDVAEIKETLEPLQPYVEARRRLRKWLAGGALGTLIVIGGWIYARGGADERAANSRQRCEQRLDRLEQLLITKGTSP